MIRAYEYRWAAPLLDRYNLHLLKKSFARIRVANLDVLRTLSGPAILTPNHSCWWDGCVDLFISRAVVPTPTYLMMGEKELSRHRVFSSLGVFSVPDGDDVRAAATSFRYIRKQLQGRPAVLWLYPQGVMSPARTDLTLREGATALSARSGAVIIPVAQRFEFLRDDHPEVIVRLGQPLANLQRRDTARLKTAMAELLSEVDRQIASDELGDYETVLEGAVSRNEKLKRINSRGRPASS